MPMMIKFYSGKVVQYLLLIIITLSINFLLPRLMPGTPLKYIAGEDVVLLSSAEKQEIMEKYGLNDSLIVQYGNYIKNILTGDFGYSFQKKQPVSVIIKSRIMWTLLLTGTNLLITSVLGIFLGTVAAWNRGRRKDVVISNIMMFLKSMPSFWIGMILVAVFGATLRWLPTFGARSLIPKLNMIDNILDIAVHLILPLCTLVILSVSSIFLTMRYSMIDVIGEDYIFMARVKGLSERRVKYRYAMRNALIPVSTVIMLNLGYMVGGTTIIETVFAYPGIGRLMYEAVLARDYPILQAVFLIITLSVIAANLLSDILYPVIDPKVV
jgi:peptide/nickel transport system permease protein